MCDQLYKPKTGKKNPNLSSCPQQLSFFKKKEKRFLSWPKLVQTKGLPLFSCIQAELPSVWPQSDVNPSHFPLVAYTSVSLCYLHNIRTRGPNGQLGLLPWIGHAPARRLCSATKNSRKVSQLKLLQVGLIPDQQKSLQFNHRLKVYPGIQRGLNKCH